MLQKSALVFAAVCWANAHAGPAPVSSSRQFSELPDLPALDAAALRFTHADEMDLDDEAGGLSVSRLQLFSVLSKPIRPIEGLMILPTFEYKLTSLDFDGVASGFPIRDEDLHSVNLSAIALSMRDDTPWVWGAFAQAKMNSDFQHIDGDDFTFDVAGGLGYRFSSNFVFGVGGAVTNFNGSERFFPGINFDWIVNDSLRIGAYGPIFLATYNLSDDWQLNLRGESGGGIWNITDDGGRSHSIDLRSYNLSLIASRRLSGNLWLNAGGGFTFGNEVRLTRTSGDKLFTDDLDSGLFGTVSLTMRAW
jgi:hypothetical protein